MSPNSSQVLGLSIQTGCKTHASCRFSQCRLQFLEIVPDTLSTDEDSEDDDSSEEVEDVEDVGDSLDSVLVL